MESGIYVCVCDGMLLILDMEHTPSSIMSIINNILNEKPGVTAEHDSIALFFF